MQRLDEEQILMGQSLTRVRSAGGRQAHLDDGGILGVIAFAPNKGVVAQRAKVVVVKHSCSAPLGL